MKLKVKDMDISTGGTLVAIINKKDAQLLDIRSGDRLNIKIGKRETTVAINISESKRAVPQGKIGLFEEVLSKLSIKDGARVKIELAETPESVNHIRDKLFGKKLAYKELFHIISDITEGKLTTIEKTYFVAGSHTVGLTMQEIVDLTKAMVKTGDQLSFGKRVFDKHSIGGVPGNRTTPIIVPIVAAAGLKMPKTSSRAITSPAGTADTMEVLTNVSLSLNKLKSTVKKTNACMVWGGAINLAPADDKIIDVEHPLSLDTEGQMLASVMAKKVSVGATHVLIDIPCGEQAKCKTKKHAQHISKMFKTLAQNLKIKAKVIITDGNQPIGNGIGPVLEANDILNTLQNKKSAPNDLREKSLMMAGMILGMAGIKNGHKKATELLESGAAWKKMQQIIKMQGKRKKQRPGKYSLTIKSNRSGTVKKIHNASIAKIARIAGAPNDKGAGIYLHKKTGNKVKKGEPLFTVYAESKEKLQFAKKFANNGTYKI